MNKIKQIKLSSIEYLGLMGLTIWLSTIFLRKYFAINKYASIFYVLPNFTSALFLTAILKQLVSPVFFKTKLLKYDFTKRFFLLTCVIVFIASFISELIFLNFKASFDLMDVLASFLAELIIFITPIILKEDIFMLEKYDDK